MNPTPDSDDPLRKILDDVSRGRLTADEAFAKVDDQVDARAQAAQQDPCLNRTASPKAAFLVGLVLLLMGLIFGGVGASFGWSTYKFSQGTLSAEGTVVRLDQSSSTSKPGKPASRNKVPIVRYTVDGRDHEVRGEISTNHAPAIGSKVSVLYRPESPDQAQIDSFTERWLFPLVFGGVGSLILLGALGMLSRSLFLFLRGSGTA